MIAKRNILGALSDVLREPTWTYHEHGPDILGWYHARVELENGQISAHAQSKAALRRKMLLLADELKGVRRPA